jgi:hypothetical protein
MLKPHILNLKRQKMEMKNTGIRTRIQKKIKALGMRL